MFFFTHFSFLFGLLISIMNWGLKSRHRFPIYLFSLQCREYSINAPTIKDFYCLGSSVFHIDENITYVYFEKRDFTNDLLLSVILMFLTPVQYLCMIIVWVIHLGMDWLIVSSFVLVILPLIKFFLIIFTNVAVSCGLYCFLVWSLQVHCSIPCRVGQEDTHCYLPEGGCGWIEGKIMEPNI